MCSADSQKIADWEVSGEAEVKMAVDSASAAQKSWARLTPMERGKVLSRAADILETRNDELAMYEAYDTSRPFQETQAGDILSAKDCFDYYSGISSTICGEHHQMPNGSFGYTVKEPLGVTCGIGAWNYPIQSAAWKVAPALACGNAIVYKPAEGE
jgi:betaine-aldehyde dehydrogenase